MKTHRTVLRGAICLVALAFCAGAADHEPSPAAVRFVPFGEGLPTAGQWREGFRVADMNGDGFPDIVLAPARKNPGAPPQIFLGDGKGHWTRWREVHFPDLAYDYGDVEVADLNSDGHPDLVLGVHLHGVLVLLGDGKGNFTAANDGLDFSERAGGSFSSRAIRVTDWNGDGLPDIVAASEGPQGKGARAGASDGIAIYLNQTTRKNGVTQTSWHRLGITLSPGIFTDSITLGDFNGDHHIDIAIGSSMMGRNDLINLWAAKNEPKPLSVEIPAKVHYVQAVAAADFEKRGRDDLVVAYDMLESEKWYSAADLYSYKADGKWERKALAKELTREGLVKIASGHFRNRDTRDLVALTAIGETVLFLSDGHGGYMQNPLAIPLYGGGCRGSHIELADLDGDGIDEIVSSFAGEPEGQRCPSGGGVTVWKTVQEAVKK